ncbi:hypothetical protein ACFE04_030439 [Oxalis oulophora]
MSRTTPILSIFLPIIIVLLSSSKTTSSSSLNGGGGGSRSILREFYKMTKSSSNKINVDLVDRAVDINATNFDSTFKETPAAFAIVEFFAHWCPACRNYKPHYEKVARLFNGHEAVHPGIVLMTRVDCAQKINNKLCEKFSVSHYPMLFWGPPSKFVSARWESKQEKSEIRVIDDGRTDERLLNWINKQLGSSYALADRKFENENIAPNVSADPSQIARAVYDVEEATAYALEFIMEDKMIKPETRGAFLKFLQLLVAHHPSRRCRKGSADILVNFDEVWPIDKPEVAMDEENSALVNFQICGKDIPRGYWMFCRGSKNETRGFSCGLWVLLHSISVKIQDGESQFAFTTICGFVHHFYNCQECREHFDDICKSIRRPFTKSRDLALWLWSAHNKINGRLIMVEALGPIDPMFPKAIWPTRELCPLCHNGHINWNQDEVYKFLTTYYGTTLTSIIKDRNLLGNEVSDGAVEDLVGSTNALAVPMGAALAIAIASCTFGALACYWRSLQKTRKYFLSRFHFLKNI